MRRLYLVVGLVFALGALLAAGTFWTTMETPLHVSAGGVVVNVPAGASAREVAQDLDRRGILVHPRLWALYARLSGRAAQIKQGEYRLQKGMTPAGLLDLLVAGRTVQYPITLVDGWTFRQIMRRLNQDPHIKHTLKPADYGKLIQRLGGPVGMSPEGWFYPNTYFFSNGASDVSILRRAYDAMHRYLERQWSGRAPDLPLKTPYQALILASIVERESSLAHERRLIAGVFVNRLRKGMRLQSDPTVIYGLGSAYHGVITFKDLRSDTPYNTYVHTGLPPTPISIPSPTAVHAVLHPANTDYLYFVAKGDGTHVFSRTYAEQERAVAKYLLRRKAAAKGG